MVVATGAKFIVALLVPTAPPLRQSADQGIKFASNAELAAHAWVHCTRRFQRSAPYRHLAQYETIKRFALLPEDLLSDNGGLTFTLKLKRRVVEQQYAPSSNPSTPTSPNPVRCCRNEISLFFCSPSSFVAVLSYSLHQAKQILLFPMSRATSLCKTGIEFNNAHLILSCPVARNYLPDEMPGVSSRK